VKEKQEQTETPPPTRCPARPLVKNIPKSLHRFPHDVQFLLFIPEYHTGLFFPTVKAAMGQIRLSAAFQGKGTPLTGATLESSFSWLKNVWTL